MMKHTRETSFLVSNPTLEVLPVPDEAFREGTLTAVPWTVGHGGMASGLGLGGEVKFEERPGSLWWWEAAPCGFGLCDDSWCVVAFQKVLLKVAVGHSSNVTEGPIVASAFRVAVRMVDR